LHEKRRLFLILIIAFAGLTFLLSTPSSNALAVSSAPGAREFTIVVSRHGFNETAVAFSITVEEGALVKITFVYGDTDLLVDNPHAIALDGYGIETASIVKTNPTVTVQFIADVPGTFNFYCYIPCLGMENLLGHMIVTPAQGSRVPTTLDLGVASTNPSYSLISATVKDLNGTAMEGVPVKFYENTTFGLIFLKTAPTDSLGVAVLNYTTNRGGNIQIIAENPGSTQYANSSKSVLVTVSPQAEKTEGKIYLGMKEVGQPSGTFYGISYPPNLSMIAVPRMMNILVVILAGFVVLGVWSTYAYIGRQIASLPKYGSPRPEEVGMIPPSVTPLEVGGPSVPKADEFTNKTLFLLLLLPLLGVTDVFVVNSFGLSILGTASSLIGLAVLETAAIVLAITGRTSKD
jgi:hypothetical protein